MSLAYETSIVCDQCGYVTAGSTHDNSESARESALLQSESEGFIHVDGRDLCAECKHTAKGLEEAEC